MRSRWCERSASSSASSRGRLAGGRWAIRAAARLVAPLPALARHPRGQVLLQRLDAPRAASSGAPAGSSPSSGELVAQVCRDHKVLVVPRQLLRGALGGPEGFHGLPGEDVHHHQAILRLPPGVLAEVDEVGLQPVVRPLGGRLAQRTRPGRLHLPAHVGLQHLEGHCLRSKERGLILP